MIYRFADCALDTQLHILHRDAQSTGLAPKVFEVLCYLIEHRDRVISKQELCDQVWEGVAISDSTLESCLRMVRLAVGDSGQAQRIIQTQRGYGYRFLEAVTAVAAHNETEESSTLSLELLEDAGSTSSHVPREGSPPSAPRAASQLCVACQHTNDESAIFCAACGALLRQHCGRCGQSVTSPAAFCTACGQSLTAPSSAHPVDAAAGQAERKPITVLCCTATTTTASGVGFDQGVGHPTPFDPRLLPAAVG